MEDEGNKTDSAENTKKPDEEKPEKTDSKEHEHERKQTIEIRSKSDSATQREKKLESIFIEEKDKMVAKLSKLAFSKKSTEDHKKSSDGLKKSSVSGSKKSLDTRSVPSIIGSFPSMTGASGSLGKSTSRSLKVFNFMENRQMYRVIVDGIDYTPDDLIDPGYVTMEEGFTHAAFDAKPTSEVLMPSKSKAFKSSTVARDGGKIYATTINLDDIYIDYTLNTEVGIVTERDRKNQAELETAPSAFYLPKMNPLTSYPEEILVTLKETPTKFLFILPQLSFDKNSADAAAIEADNEFYQFITVGKGRNRKTVSQETQTILTITQSRHTLAIRPTKRNAASFASMWDMHDTYAELEDAKPPEEEDEMVLYQSAAAHLLRKKKQKKMRKDLLAVTFENMANKANFLDAALVTQRVLASKKFSKEQKKFRGLVDMDPYSLDLIYIYTMKALWTLQCEESVGRPISSISFNPRNENILAVGYGKFAFAEKRRGLVCIWNTKNPCKPERTYWFQNAITAVAFSAKTPDALAIGFTNGDVVILDITFYTVKTLAMSKRETNPSYEPVWVTEWHIDDSDHQYVMTTCQDGRINKFISTKTHDFICVPMMRITKSEGKLRGIDLPKPCLLEDVPIDRHPGALCLKWQPSAEHMYLVGTDEGCIHRCSTHYLNQHVDVFRAHAGPVYYMDFSPFNSALLLTCGADGAIRLWIEGIDAVIITLTCDAAVYGATFCPINSTVILSVSGNVLSVWDLRRKTHIPCAEHNFPQDVTLTFIKFSTSGHNVFVGDSEGCVHTFHLEDTPIPPFYQRKLLDETIKKALCTRPHLLRQLEKMESYKRV